MIEEDDWYYDNKLEPDNLNAHLYCVERVYGLAFDEFTEADWASLTRIYRLLPGWLRFGDDGCPYWFGVDEDVPPYLWASVEPSGLLVHGVLAPADWEGWDSQFRELAVALPRQRIV